MTPLPLLQHGLRLVEVLRRRQQLGNLRAVGLLVCEFGCPHHSSEHGAVAVRILLDEFLRRRQRAAGMSGKYVAR